MELLRIFIENVLFHLSELFTYLNKVILLLGQRGLDIRGRTVMHRGVICLQSLRVTTILCANSSFAH